MVSVPVAAVTLLVFLGSFATAQDVSLDRDWRDWKEAHGREYKKKGEEEYRRSIWESNVHVIRRHNQEASQGKHTYRLEMNQFGDLGALRCSVGHSRVPPEPWKSFECPGNFGNLVSLSEQNLMDCSIVSRHRMAAVEGWMPVAFEYAAQNNGIDSEQSFHPYFKAQSGLPCRYSTWNRAATCKSLVTIQSGDEQALEEAVAVYGPVSIAIDAASMQFQFYSSASAWVDLHAEALQHADENAIQLAPVGARRTVG
uniref:Uncharacterized protein n=1 Tax=Sphaerodactylus townsendi TaxID=933632 RepID=A0ACB8F1D8_9SAUR